MTKKDFEAIAAILSSAATLEESGRYESEIVDFISSEIAGFCQKKNPRFNRALFLRACKSQSE